MARKNTSKTTKATKTVKKAPEAPTKTASRGSPVPPSAKPIPAKREITREQIAVRAFEIFMGGTGGDELANWLRAERELRG